MMVFFLLLSTPLQSTLGCFISLSLQCPISRVVKPGFAKVPGNLTFIAPNTASQHRSQRYPEVVWDKHKEDLIRHYLQGGLANVLRWVENQNTPDFHPTYVSQQTIDLKAYP